jgi:hypothetical protein
MALLKIDKEFYDGRVLWRNGVRNFGMDGYFGESGQGILGWTGTFENQRLG